MNGNRFFSSLFPLGIVSVILFLSLVTLYRNLDDSFQQLNKYYEEGSSVVLNKDVDTKVLQEIIVNNGYAKNSKDAAFIADSLKNKLQNNTPYPSLYTLKKRNFGKVSVTAIDSTVLTDAVRASKDKLGQNDSVFNYKAGSIVKGKGIIVVYVKEEDSIKQKKYHPCPKVPVRLRAHYRDAKDSVHNTTLGFVITDANGKAVFENLDTSLSYSVLPIKAGYEYGAEKGTTSGRFSTEKQIHKLFGDMKTLTYSFEQKEHLIPLFDNHTLKQIKADQTFTVRTPAEWKNVVNKYFFLVLLGWWVLALVIVFRKKHFDSVMLAAAMFLTGLCILIMFAIQNPLTEELKGVEMAKGALIGLVLVILLQFVDFIKFYRNHYKLDFDIVVAAINWLFLPFKRKVAWLAQILSGDYAWWKKTGALILLMFCLPFGLLNLLKLDKLNPVVEKFCKKLPKGFGWLLLAILLTAMLFTPFGQSIGGMKVNLKLGPLTFQPSEIAKYLILLFMAAFFTQNADTIINYSRPAKTRMMDKIWRKVKTLSWVIGGLLVLMGLYAALGDMGPGLVIGITFLLLYSLVKSKVNLENISEDDKWKRIFTCDFAMLIYGVISFAAFMIVGYAIDNSLLLFFALLWFIAWIVFGFLRHRQFFETAFIMNMLIFMFIFGGQIMQGIPQLKDTDTAERFEARTRMCVNTWGDWETAAKKKNYDDAKKEAVSNTQVANGLWAIATGGMTGQGLGKGNPNLIPAFHTDMILSSIGEEIGWIGLLVVVLVLALLLRRMIVVGYKVGHPFAFYFCSGVAIVTGVQFFIIALGSSGMIPLTGITVPFLSYGRVSMILNLAAFGVVLSLSQNVKTEHVNDTEHQVRQRSVGDYNYPISIISWTFVVLALITLNVWQFYSLWARKGTLVHPAFVYNKGVPLIEYNPRIDLLTKEMWAGNIYDRDSLLLATSDKSRIIASNYKECGIDEADIKSELKTHLKRYYPLGEQLFFMLGDINNGLYFAYDEDNPIGFMAEAQYLSYLRDFDNVKRDKDGNAVKVDLLCKPKGRFLEGSIDTVQSIVIRDYKELIPYLEDGIHGDRVKKHNEKVSKGDYDLQLTLDAKLQCQLQDSIESYVNSNSLKNKNLLRISVVVLDAKNGDLLTSANYPLPDYTRLRREDSIAIAYGKKYAKYSDYYKNKEWKAYTDRDLGMTYPTAPGSTAKVVSAMAGLNKLGVSRVQHEAIFPVYRYEVIDLSSKTKKSKEPPLGFVEKALVSMHDAIVESSNCYFINLVNRYDCYDELEKIYAAVGLSVGKSPNHKKAYSLHFKHSDVLHGIVRQQRSEAVPSYNEYIRKREANEFVMNKDWKKLGRDEWMWAWGQGTMDATPLNMARVVSAVANGGMMPVTQYLMRTADKDKKRIDPEYVPLTTKKNAEELQSYMKDQAKEKGGFASFVGGKTGTPERVWVDKDIKVYDKKTKSYKMIQNTSNKPNDGWYIFYVETGNDKHPILAVAVRMERLGDAQSGEAMKLAKTVVLKALRDRLYLNN